MWGTRRARVGLVWEKTGTILMVLKILCPGDIMSWVTACTHKDRVWVIKILLSDSTIADDIKSTCSSLPCFPFLETIGVVICSCLNGICFNSYPSFKEEKFIVLFQWKQSWKYVTRKSYKFMLTCNLSYFSLKKTSLSWGRWNNWLGVFSKNLQSWSSWTRLGRKRTRKWTQNKPAKGEMIGFSGWNYLALDFRSGSFSTVARKVYDSVWLKRSRNN